MQLIRPANLLLSRLYNSSAIAHAEDEAEASYVDAPRPNFHGSTLPRVTAPRIAHVVTEFIGEYPLRHPLKVWRDMRSKRPVVSAKIAKPTGSKL